MDTRELVALEVQRAMLIEGDAYTIAKEATDAIMRVVDEDRAELVKALRKIAYEPIGDAEATDHEVLHDITAIARDAIAHVHITEHDDGCELRKAASAALDLGWTHDDECHPSEGRHSDRCIEARRVKSLLRAALGERR